MNIADQDPKIRPDNFQIASKSNYGFLNFIKNKNIPVRQWGGWASIGGDKPFKFNNISELAIDIVWLTNLEKNESWKLGKFKKFKDSAFFGIDILKLMTENIINDESVENYSQVFSEIFSLTIDQISEFFSHFNIQINFQDGNAYDFIRKVMGNKDEVLDYSFEKIIEVSYDENIKIRIPQDKTKGKKILTLSKMRSSYFNNLISKTRYPSGNWMPIGKDKLPELNEKKKNFIEKNNNFPMLIHIDKINIKKGNKWGLNNDMFLFLGDRLDLISNSAIWITNDEFDLIKNDVNFEIKSILINSNYNNISNPMIEKIYSNDIVFENSIVKQLLFSVLYYSLSARTRDGGSRKKFKLSPSQLWLKKQDNIEMFKTAKEFQKAGFIVTNYGNGELSILYDKDINLNELIKISEKNNIIVPTKLLDYGSLVLDIDFEDVRLTNDEKNIIFNQWIQNKWTKQTQSNLPVSLIIDRISYFINGDAKLNKSKRIKDNLQILTLYLKSISDDAFKKRFKDLYTEQITKNINKLKNLN